MKLIFSLVVLLSGSHLFAADMAFQGFLGFDRGAANVGADFDFQVRRIHSVGGYFIMGTESDTVRRQFWSLGGDVKVFFGPDDWKLYLAPGLGMASFDLANGESEMTFGSMMKVGSLLEVTTDIFVGLEVMYYANWFSDAAPASFMLTNATVRIPF